MREQTHSLKIVSAVAPGAYAADVTPVALDRLGFASVTFAIGVGVGGITFSGTNKIEFVLEESYDGEDWTPVLAKDVAGLDLTADDGIVRALRTAHAQPSTTQLGYIGDARYVRLRPDFSGTHGTATPFSAVAILGRPAQYPAAA